MVVLTAFLFVIFGQTRTGSTNGYSAVFNDASRLEAGDTVRVAGIRVGTVEDVSLQADRKVLVDFDADRNIVLTTGTKAAIRYLNLVGDRYLELVDTPGLDEDPAGGLADSGRPHRAGARPRPAARRAETRYPGPRIRRTSTRSPRRWSRSCRARAARWNRCSRRRRRSRTALADNNQVIEQLIDNLQHVLDTLSRGRRRVLRCRSTSSRSWSPACRRTAIRSAPPSRRWTTGPRRWPTCSPRRGRRWPARSTS